ncbi:leucine-rich repeat and WD repeat-containing protein 1 isoform X2 [Lates japonicus]|uniref:Leucine-rich repeat and WD repeat-containing protein 1 n=1 Tax=Lates japonicus TaxID=270547 RepID=A0AAD3QVH5_LATJO|nr:leucine-rich repeat and WD repeat-containing protein 1 isoform X2 [Lates japonicus]
MEKITEKLLLEKGSPKTNKLEQIKTLNLSKMGLKHQDLPVRLLSRLQSLEQWDLSGNRLQELPKNLKLPALRCLDLSDNQMEDVTTLESLSNLEELKMEDNLYITVSDNHKMMVLLPNLRIFNGKDVSPTANHLRYVYTDNLRTRVIAVWEKSFHLPDPITAEKLSSLEKEFVNAARQQVRFGPSSVSDFTKWKVEIIAKEYLHSLTEPQKEPESNELTDTKENSEIPTPTKRKQTTSVKDSDVSLTPRKQLRTDLPASSVEDSPRKSSLRLKPLKTLSQASAVRMSPRKTGGSGGSRLVATCGGDSLCVIDCETGMVMKKYKVPGEEFFSLAWSTVLMSRGGGAPAQHCSILAAGGKRGLVKLIHPRNNIAYGEFRASRKALSVLRFNHHKGNFLFSGSYDNKIIMWDIGGVDSQYNYKVVQLLVLEISATPLHICLPPTSPSANLLTACEDGLHCFNTQLGTNNMKRSKEMEITFPIYKKEDKDHDYHTIDGLSFLTDDIVASKNYMHGSIYLWSWSRTKAQRPDKKNRTVCAVVLAELQWANTEIPYLALNTCPGQAYIVCGDDKGRLWTYHVTNLQRNSFQTGKPILPTEVLEWPVPVRKGLGHVEGPSINSVAMDPELQYLVALSDRNMVIVWKREESS